MRLYLDTETYSATPIKAGTYRYLADAELLLVTWAVDDEAARVWDCTQAPMPDDLVEALQDADEVIAHNAMFDRTALRLHLAAYAPPLWHWRCTMVQALAHSLPGGLGQLCDILRVPQDKAKDKRGKELLRLFCQPRPKFSKLRRATAESHPLEWRAFIEYALSDIDAVREVHRRLPRWNFPGNAQELELWHLDQEINDRGFEVDLDLARAAIAAVDTEQARLAIEADRLTDGAVQKATQRDALLEHLAAEHGLVLTDLRGSTVGRALESADLPAALRELLEVRRQASTTSVSKYKALEAATVNGRLSGTLQFCGASRTGRWAGRTFQPQNLPRPALDAEEVELGIQALKAGAADLLYPNVMELVSSAVRGCIVAPAGRKLVVADLSNIEGRALAWIAGEAWKLDAFRAFDRGVGPDLYKLAYAKSFGVRPEDVSKAERQVGKVQELALGYEGGVGAFLTFAQAYRIDLEAMARTAWDTLPGDLVEEASDFYAWSVDQGRPTHGLTREAFITCDVFKRGWRRGHPATAGLWRELQVAVLQAIDSPRQDVKVRSLRVRRDGAWLRIVLPSGRSLCYPSPRIGEDGGITYMGVDQYTRRFERIATYGGKLVENVTQAVARDVLAGAMPAIEAAGYRIVLSIHDELLTEAPDTGEHNDQDLARLMSAPPPWAQDMPLAAAGFTAKRYRKD